jgi:P-type Cu+ transporter
MDASIVEESVEMSNACVHCGLDCPPNPPRIDDKIFCCAGCRMVYQLLSDSGMERFYNLDENPGVKPPDAIATTYAALDQPEVRRRVVDFTNGKVTRVTFRAPAMHCAACVWLLENLYRLIPGVGRSEVNFPRKEVTIFIEDADVKLSAVAEQLARLGYPPELKLDRLSGLADPTGHRRLLLQLGIAGFAFGNVMLLSFPAYLGLDPQREVGLARTFGFASLLLSIPVLLYSARDFFAGAWRGLNQRYLTIDFPLALGIAALFFQSAVDILSHTGEGYLDSFTGLVFLLLCGRWFQQRTYDALSFDRDYKSYFPLSVTRRRGGRDEAVGLDALHPGDRVLVRHGEIIPADGAIISGEGRLDYSFVTGESEPVPAVSGDYVYAGGRQTGGALEIDLVKEVSQSYLTSLWDSEAFRKPREQDLKNLTDRAGRYFTVAVVIIASFTALYWWRTDPAMLARTFTAVLIVACPCALALAAPFTFSTAQRFLGKAGLFLRSPNVMEALAKTDEIVFDKTGTLTSGPGGGPHFEGAPLREEEQAWITALAAQSSHPLSRAIVAHLETPSGGTRSVASEDDEKDAARTERDSSSDDSRGSIPAGRPLAIPALQKPSSENCRAGTAIGLPAGFPSSRQTPSGGLSLQDYAETPGGGIRGCINGHDIALGSADWLQVDAADRHGTWLVIDQTVRGRFVTGQGEREGLAPLIASLREQGYRLTLLSGDKSTAAPRFRALFGEAADLRFEQSPHDKLNYIRERQAAGHRILMLGDGLNDAGALKQSDAGLAVSDDIALFTPACDAVLQGMALARLPAFLRFARSSLRVLKSAFAVSLVYNITGLTFAASGALSPLVSAILMPLSSFSVIGFSLMATSWAARKSGMPQ